MFKCIKRSCSKSEKAHAREYEYIENTQGPRAADDYADKHRNKYEDDDK